MSCRHHLSCPVFRSTATRESVRGFVPGRSCEKYSGVAEPVPKKTVLVSGSAVTGVQTAPPPTMRLCERQLCRSGGIVQTGFGHAGRRSVVHAITKPRTPYSEPAAPAKMRCPAQIGALVSE